MEGGDPMRIRSILGLVLVLAGSWSCVKSSSAGPKRPEGYDKEIVSTMKAVSEKLNQYCRPTEGKERTFNLRMTIAETGEVLAVDVLRTDADDLAKACTADIVKAARFPAAGTEPIRIIFPVTIGKQQPAATPPDQPVKAAPPQASSSK
jgi:hypothetical protein